MSIGIQATGAVLVTQALLPAGSDVYFALFEDEAGTVECTDPGYSRVAYTGWSQSLDGKVRSNTGPIEWLAFVADTHVGAVGWFDDAVAGNLLYAGLITNQASGIDALAGDFIVLPVGLFTLRVE